MKSTPARTAALATMIGVGAGASAAVAGFAPIVYGLTDNNRLVSFAPTTPGSLASNVPIGGLGAGESMLNIDFRPFTGALFGVSSANRMYSINTATGAATLVLSNPAPTPFSTPGAPGMDFNPVPDRIRIVSSDDQNLRLNPDNGGLAANDGATLGLLRYASGDPAFGVNPNVTSVAYTNSAFTATRPLATVLYGIDTSRSTLLRHQGVNNGTPTNPNDGVLYTVAPLTGIAGINNLTGFDIYQASVGGAETAYLSTNAPGAALTYFYTLNLGSGGAGLLGTIGNGSVVVRDISVAPTPGSGLALMLAGMTLLRRRQR